MSRPGNPFDGIFRTLNWKSQSLTAATANDGTRVNVPFIGNVDATTAVLNLTGAGANHFNVRFIARDANGNIETNPVTVAISGPTGTISAAAAAGGGTIGTKITTALGQEVSVVPNATTGRVDLDVTVSAAEAKSVTIRQRWVTASGSITVV